MKALILVGGYGTRLRPLTLSAPKPLVEFANFPMVMHQIVALKKAGVDEVVLAVNYQPEVMAEAMEKYAKKYDVKITYSRETEPLGTAGPLKLAEKTLRDGDPFFVLNSDIICDFCFEDMLAYHRKHGGEGTIMVTKVEEPSKYGVVVSEDDGLIKRFVEKPKEFVSNRINAGMYVFQPEILDRIEPRPTSIEREIFPKMCSDKKLFSMDLPGFWMDIGQPKDFLHGLCLYLQDLLEKKSPLLERRASLEGVQIIEPVIIHPSAVIGKGSLVGPNVSIGKKCVIGEGVRLVRSCILSSAQVSSYAWVQSSVVGWRSHVGKWARLENICVLGEDVRIGDEVYVNGGKILPHKSINTSVPTPQVIM